MTQIFPCGKTQLRKTFSAKSETLIRHPKRKSQMQPTISKHKTNQPVNELKT